jgi:PKD repeat protein
VAVFDYSCAENEISFQNLSSNSDSCMWNFGDGIFSYENDPVHIYLDAGIYNAILVVSNDCGIDTSSQEIIVPCTPMATFIYSIDKFEVRFDNNSFNATGYLWDFGDGESSQLEDPIHIYPEIGEYNVQLIAFNEFGSDTSVLIIDITQIIQFTQADLIRIFPNPAKEELYISFQANEDESIQFQFLNVGGQIVIADRFTIRDTNYKMDISYLPKGIYFLRIVGEQRVYTQKIFII